MKCTNCGHKIYDNERIKGEHYHAQMNAYNECFHCGCTNPEPEKIILKTN